MNMINDMEKVTTPSYSPYFNPEVETMSREQLEQLQLERLKKTVNHCMNAPFYQKRFQEPDEVYQGQQSAVVGVRNIHAVQGNGCL